jgi:uridine kinase
LNELAFGGSKPLRDFIRINEIYAEKNFSDAAQYIYQRRDETRIVLLAGPSSSGKTTSAKRLCLHLQVLGLRPITISLDDYYLPRDIVPRDADGNYDFECLESLDVPYLNEQLLALLADKVVTLPVFNFRKGGREQGRSIQLGRRAVLVVEGIHALNDRLTPDIPRHKKCKLYVSPLTQIKIDEHHRVSSSDNRLLRRLVRDYRYRAMSAHATLEMWPRVRRGELLHIFPFQDSADYIINSALEYEIGVLRLFAEPVLRSAPVDGRTHAEAARLLALLENFAAIPPSYIPGTSVLREFIGDSDFDY